MSVLSAERRSVGECVVSGARDARGVTAGGVDCGGCGGGGAWRWRWIAECVAAGVRGSGGGLRNVWRRGLQGLRE